MALPPRRTSSLDVDPFAPPETENKPPAADVDPAARDAKPPKAATGRTPSAAVTRTKKAKPAASRRAHRVPEPQHRVEWNVHSRTVRSGLMAWAATRDRVQQRAEDVRELIRSAGAAVTEDDLVAIVLQVAENTGYPETEVAEAAGFEIES
jgi:hypothetical protein